MADTRQTSIVIPAFNESPTIGELVTSLRAAASWQEVLVVDDGSDDDTSARATEAG
ncbi:MAG: glycosyltransferase, partial [Acidobacteria bacterium]